MPLFLNNLIYERLIRLDFTSPLVFLDFFIALSLVVGSLLYLRRFPSFRVILGTLLLLICSLFFFVTGFILTSLVFGIASTWVLISLPLIFASELRHYLGKLGRFNFLNFINLRPTHKNETFIRNLVDAVYEMAEREIGATIVIARKTGLGQTIETGVIIDATFSSKLIQNIFFKKSPLHDGAVVIKENRIYAAGCLLPISSEVRLDPPFGTRHRSGLAITRDTDAIVILVSEQRGEVSLAENGKLEVNLDRPDLIDMLSKLI